MFASHFCFCVKWNMYDLGSSISSKKSSDKKVNNFLEEAGGGLPLILVDFVSIVTIPFEWFYPIRPYMADIDLELKTFWIFYY